MEEAPYSEKIKTLCMLGQASLVRTNSFICSTLARIRIYNAFLFNLRVTEPSHSFSDLDCTRNNNCMKRIKSKIIGYFIELPCLFSKVLEKYVKNKLCMFLYPEK